MTQDAPNKNTSDITWSKVFSDTSCAPEQVAEKAVVASEPDRGISDTITGDYSSLDHLDQRQDASTNGNSIGSGAYKVSGSGFVNVYGDADLLALGQSRVYSRGHAKVAASQGAMIFATDQVKVTASGKAAVCATGAAKVYASDEVVVVALDRTEIYASGRVKIKAFGSCTVYASGDSEVEVSDPTGCTIFLCGNAKQITVADAGR